MVNPIEKSIMKTNASIDQVSNLAGDVANSNINDINNSTYRKRVIGKLNFKFSGYTDALSKLGITSLYPQGITFDEKGMCYISYISNLNNGGVIVVYNENLIQKYWFAVSALKVENIVVNKGYLYFRGENYCLCKADISNLKNGDVLSKFINLNIKTAANFSYSHGRWLIGRSLSPFGTNAATVRTVYDFYDDDFNNLGFICINPIISGIITKDDSEFYDYIPKSQGILLHKDRIYLGIGNYWNTKNPVSNNSAFGAVELTLDGNLCRYGVIAYSGFKEYLEKEYNIKVFRLESEGIAYNPQTNLLHTLLIAGDFLLLVSEFDSLGSDFEKIKAKYSPLNLKQLSRLPVQYDKNLKNPITNKPFDSQSSIMKFMADMNITQFEYYSPFAVNVKPIDETFTGESSLITIKNCSNNVFIVEVQGIVNHINKIYFTNNDFSAYKIYPQCAVKQNIFSFLSNSGTGFLMPTPDKKNNIGLFNGYSDGVSLNKLYLGSSQKNRLAPTSIGFCLSNNTGAEGTERITVTYNNMYPVKDNTLEFGRTTNRWKNIYSTKGVITTSDVRLKTDIQSFTDSEKRVAMRLKALIKKFKFINSIKEKQNSARIHIGIIAQEVLSAFEAEGLDAFDYGIVCYDKWDSLNEITEKTEDGETITLQKAIKAGDRYSIRYDELAMFILGAL